MDIILREIKMQFRNPILGQPTRPVEEHYYARRVTALVNGYERFFRFFKDEIPFLATEDDIALIIESKVQEEEKEKQKQEQPTNAE